MLIEAETCTELRYSCCSVNGKSECRACLFASLEIIRGPCIRETGREWCIVELKLEQFSMLHLDMILFVEKS